MLRQVLLLATVSVALAAVARQALEKKPEEYKNCDGCWVSAIQEFIPINETVPSPTSCFEYYCTSTEVQLLSCGAVAAKPPCRVVEDKSALYPDCCPNIVCDKE